MVSAERLAELKSHEFWHRRVDVIGETETRAEYGRLGLDGVPPAQAMLVQSAMELGIKGFRLHEEAARPVRDEQRAIRTMWWTRAAVALSVLALGASLATYSLAFSDDEGDRRWRREQAMRDAELLRVMTEIRDELRAPPTP